MTPATSGNGLAILIPRGCFAAPASAGRSSPRLAHSASIWGMDSTAWTSTDARIPSGKCTSSSVRSSNRSSNEFYVPRDGDRARNNGAVQSRAGAGRGVLQDRLCESRGADGKRPRPTRRRITAHEGGPVVPGPTPEAAGFVEQDARRLPEGRADDVGDRQGNAPENAAGVRERTSAEELAVPAAIRCSQGRSDGANHRSRKESAGRYSRGRLLRDDSHE